MANEGWRRRMHGICERVPSWCLVALVSLALGTPASAQTERLEWEMITSERLLHPEDGDWLNYRRTYDVQGFSPLDEIDRTNVDELQPIWTYSFRDNNRWSPTPMVANGNQSTAWVRTGASTRWFRPAIGCPPMCTRTCPRYVRSSMAHSFGPEPAAKSELRGRGHR